MSQFTGKAKMTAAESDAAVAAATAAASAPSSGNGPGAYAAAAAMPQNMIDVNMLTPEQATNRLIEHATDLRASDLFFTSNEQHCAVLVRHLGIVHPISILSADLGRRSMQHLKAIAGMDLTEKRRPADGRWIYRRDNGTVVDLRINVVPTIYGEDFAVRILARDTTPFDLNKLGMSQRQEQLFRNMIESPSGLVLITGPTGSGKTTTLYASLIHLNDGSHKINTIEDPVEYAIAGLRQSQVNGAINLGFAELLRGILRQSPDVIMIGEIRDPETAQTAVHAANSGILVLATIHAPAAAGGVQSMRALGVHPHFLSTSLRGVVSQRLVRTFCPNCKTGFDLGEDTGTFDDVRKWLAPGEGKTLYAAKGCEQCSMEGYTGRTGVFEVMPVSKDIRNLIGETAPTRAIRAKAVEEGMIEFRQGALLKVAQGQTSTEEVFRVIPSEHLLMED